MSQCVCVCVCHSVSVCMCVCVCVCECVSQCVCVCVPRWSGVFPMLSLSLTEAPYEISNWTGIRKGILHSCPRGLVLTYS